MKKFKQAILKLLISVFLIYGCLAVLFLDQNFSENVIGIFCLAGLFFIPMIYKYVGRFFKNKGDV